MAAVLAVAALAWLPVAAAGAATVTVSGGAPDSTVACSASPCPNLRAAVAFANANPGTTISLAAGSYSLSLGELDLTQNTTIVGQGMSATRVEQTDGVDRVLETAPGTTILLQGLELTGGVANIPLSVPTNAYDYGGGGILDQSVQLTLDHVLIDNNQSVGATEPDGATGPTGHGGQEAVGGGIDIPFHPPTSAARTLTITNSTISGNTAQGGAGGAMTTSTLNDAGHGGAAVGGAIYAGQDTAISVSDSTFHENRAIGGPAGGDAISGQTGPGDAGYGGSASGGAINTAYGSTSLVRVTMSANAAIGGAPGADMYSSSHVGVGGDGMGGAFGSGAAGTIGTHSLYVENSTLTGNSAAGGVAGVATVNGGDPGAGYGGALQLYPGSVTIYSSTIDGNSATGGPGSGVPATGGGNLDVLGTTLELEGTIIAGGSTPSGNANCQVEPSSSPAATFYDDGNNLESSNPAQCGLSASTDLLGVDPLVQAPVNNGGPTETMALAAGSPALGSGGDCYVVVDQRSFPRPAGQCDIGAFQHQTSVTKTADASIAGTPSVGQTLTCSGATFAGDSLTISYVWLRNGAAISGATGSSYTLVGADLGAQVSCRVTATGPAGAASTTSAAVTVSAASGAGGASGSGGGGAGNTTGAGGSAAPSGAAGPGVLVWPKQNLSAGAGGRVKATIVCSAGSPTCSGKIQLTVAKLGGAHLRTAARRPAGRRFIVIAAESFTIAAGEQGTVTLELTRLGRSLLRAHARGLRVTIRLIEQSTSVLSRRSTLRTATPRKHR